MHLPPIIGITLLLAASTCHAQARSTDPLQPLTHCFDNTAYRAVSTDRLPAAITTRSVDTAGGPMPVSLADGYRMMVHRQSAAPLVNLKIERSVAGKFGADRAAVEAQMDAMAANSHGLHIARSVQDGIAVAGLNNPALGTPGVISFYSLFDPATGTIATAYFLHQAPAIREYATQAAYDTLRDDFIGTLAGCMATTAHVSRSKAQQLGSESN